jgi:alanine-glyoxylate transaminase / (R)-3-amino-2-methylpropionate-pyruvate transaminase
MSTTKSDTVRRHKEYAWKCATTFYEQPLVLERGEGMHVWDEEGTRYLDCFGGVLTVSVGHANEKVNAAIVEQIGKISHVPTLYVNKTVVDLSEKLAQISPGKLKKSFFTNSGTEADETAIVLARLYTGKQEFIALRHSYSGRSMLAMSVTAHAPWRHGGTYVAGVKHLAAPYCYRCPYKLTYPSCDLACAKDVKELIETTTDGQVAAFMAEPILGVGGFITPPKEYFKEVVSIVKRYGGLFICDEVQTGSGRTGDKWFGIEHWDVEPDIMTSAKGMANGAPIGWTIATEEIADAYPSATFSTFGGNPVTCAAALATLDYVEEHDLPRNAAVVGAYLRERLEGLQEKHPTIGDVRGMGLMQALEVVKDRDSKEPYSAGVQRVFEETRKRGVLIGKGGLYGNVIRLGPPLIAETSHVDELIDALDAAFATLAMN